MSKSFEEKIEMMRREIDALQISSADKAKPWYKNVSTLIAVLALLFSFGTTYVSYRRTEAQDVQSMRQELRGLLQRLAALPKERVDLFKAMGDPGEKEPDVIYGLDGKTVGIEVPTASNTLLPCTISRWQYSR
jgi:hypothetical protein